MNSVSSAGSRPFPARPSGRSAKPHPVPGEHAVATGIASLVPDGDGRGGWTMYVNGMESSHVDLHDPTRLDFEYMRWFAAMVRAWHRPDSEFTAMHLGGGGCTFPRYLQATCPGVRQQVVEVDEGVLELAKQAFGLRSGGRLRLRQGEARRAVQDSPESSADLIVRDAFSGSDVPDHLRTREFVAEVDRALTPQGIYLANLADGQLLAAARREAATLLTIFEHVALVAEPAQLRGRRYGNVVVAGSHAPLPVEGWSRTLASDPVRARLLETAEARRLCAGQRPFTDPQH